MTRDAVPGWASDGGVRGAVPVVLAVDVEPDGKPGNPATDRIQLDGFRATAAFLENLRPRLEDVTGAPVNFSWFLRMDPQIETLAGRATALADLAARELESLAVRGDAFGLHTHAGRWKPQHGRWLVDHADPAWIAHCLRTSFAAFRAAFGAPCEQHRFGDRWISPAALDIVAALGGMVDLTPEPGKRGASRVDMSADATGAIPSYANLRSIPYRHRDSSLWVLPLTAADPGPALSLPVRLARQVRFLGQDLHRPLTLHRAWRSPEAYWSLVEGTISRLAAPYFAMAIRSDFILLPATSGVRYLLEDLPARGFVHRLRFTDAVGAMKLLGTETAERR